MSTKIYGLITALVIVLSCGVLVFGYGQHAKGKQAFLGDGYVLTAQETDEGMIPAPLYFTAGTSYKDVYPEGVVFKSAAGKQEKISGNDFVHYADESISSVAGGVVLELNELKNGLLNYYSLSGGTIMQKQDQQFLLDNQGEPMQFANYVWKLSKDRFLIASPDIKITLPDKQMEYTKDYLELQYIDDGVVRMVNSQSAYQILTLGSNLDLGGGMGIDLENRQITENGEAKLSLDAILLENKDNIAIASTVPASMKVPKFDITTIDGINGKEGNYGEQGETGEAGDPGKEGQIGETGAAGEAGKQGEGGTKGSQGDSGSNGSSGSSGSNGKNGSKGDTSSGGSSGSTSGVIMPVITLSKINYDTTSVEGVFTIDSEGQGVELTQGHLKITDMSSNLVIDQAEYDMSGGDFGGLQETGFNSSKLASDRKYRLEFNASYKLDTDSETGDGANGMRTFVSRTFSTNSFGIIEAYSFAKENSLTVTLTKKSYSQVSNVSVYCYQPGSNRDDSKRQIIDFGALNEKTVTFSNLDPNREYQVEVEVQDSAAAGQVVQLSANVYKTLKRPPVITNAPVVAVNPRGYFEIRPDTTPDGDKPTFSDDDNGILSYRYDIYTFSLEPGEFITSIKADGTSTTSIYSDGLLIERGKDYAARLVAVFDDNEKVVEYSSPYTVPFYIDAQTGVPYMQFIKGTETDGKDPIRYDYIHGSLRFYYNGALLDIDGTKTLQITMFDETIGEKELTTYTSTPVNGNGTYFDHLIRQSGLKANTTYRFNVYGYYKGKDSRQLLTSCSVTTPSALGIGVVGAEDVNGDGVINAILYFKNGSEGKIDVNGAQYEANNVSKIKLSLWEGNNLIKSLDYPLDVVKHDDKSFTSKFTDYCVKQNQNPDDVQMIRINNKDFGVGSETLTSSQYTMKVEGFQDYTAIDDERLAESTADINTIPVDGYADGYRIVISKLGTPPALPEEPVKVVAVLKSMLPDLGISQDLYSTLPNQAVVGYILRPQYDNSSKFATSYTMYGFDKKNYDSIFPQVQDPKNKPLDDNKDSAEFVCKYEQKSATWGDFLPGLVVLMGTGNEGKVLSTDPSLNGMRYIYGGAEFTRGKRYVFAYDVNLNINNNDKYQYPYEYEGYQDIGNILRSKESDTNCEAPRVAPTIVSYPYDMGTDTATWKLKAADADSALSSASFRLYHSSFASPGYVKSTSLDGITDTVQKYLADFKPIAFPINKATGVITFKAAYAKFNSGSVTQDVEEVEIVKMPHNTFPTATSFTVEVNKDDGSEDSISKINAVQLTITDTGSAKDLAKKAAALEVTVSSDNPALGTVVKYLEMKPNENNTYRALLPLADIMKFKGTSMTLGVKILYTSGNYGYQYANDGMYAMQNQDGMYYGWINSKLSFDVQDDIAGGAFTMKDVVLDNAGVKIPFTSLLNGKQNTFSLKFGRQGALLQASGSTSAIVMKPLILSNGVSVPGVRFQTIVPVVTDIAASRALKQVAVTFDLTKDVDDLIEGSNADTKLVKFELKKKRSGSEQYDTIRTLTVSLKALRENWAHNDDPKKTGNYAIVLDQLDIGSEYEIVLSGDLSGDGKNDAVIFRNVEGGLNSYRFTTMSTVTMTAQKNVINNQYYHYKNMDMVFGADTVTGVQFRYDVYQMTDNFDKTNPGTPFYSYEKMKTDLGMTGKPVLTEDAVKSNKIGNKVSLDIAPPNRSRIMPGNSYIVNITAYPEGTVYDSAGDYKKETVGSLWTGKMDYRTLTYPNSQAALTLGDKGDDKDTQKMNITVSLTDTNSLVISNAFYHLDENNKESVTDVNGVPLTDFSGNPDKMQLSGGYVMCIYEAVYNPGTGDRTPIGWKLLNNPGDEIYYTEPSQMNLNKGSVLHGIQSIGMQNLKDDTHYKVQIWAKTDLELKGTELMIEPDEAGSEPTPGKRDGVVCLGEYTRKTLDSTGFYIDGARAVLNQEDSGNAALILYDSAGLTKIKNIRCTFTPNSYSANEFSEDTGYLKWGVDAKIVKEEINGMGRKETKVLIPISFKKEDIYTVRIDFYGDDVTQDPLYSIADPYIKTITVTKLPAGMTSRRLVPEALLDQMILAAEDRKRKAG